MTEDGYIILYKLDFAKKRGLVISSSRLQLIEDRKEDPKSISVCDKNQYAFIEIGENKSPFISSRMIVFRICGNSLIKKASIDQYSQRIGLKLAVESLGYLGSQILWVGVSRLGNGVAQLYVYDTGTGEFKELEGKRVYHREDGTARFHRLGAHLYYTGWNGKLMRLGLKFDM